MQTASSPTNRTLAGLQSILLSLIPLFVAHTWFDAISVTPTAFNIIFELHGIVLKLSDFPFFVLMIVTTLRCLLDEPYRQRLRSSINALLRWRSNQAWFGLVALMFLSALWARAPYLAVYQAVYTLLMLVMIVVMVASQAGQARWWMITLITGACLQGLLAVAQVINNGSVGLGWLGEPAIPYGRAFGLTYNPNTLAGYLLIASALTFAFAWINVRRSSTRVLILFAGIGIVAGLLATRSRTSVIAFVLVVGCWLFRWLWLHLSQRFTMIITPLVIVIGVFTAFAVVGRGFDTREISNRLTFAYAGSWVAYRQSPILGVGVGQVMLRVDSLISADTLPYYDLQSDGLLQPGHNAYLNVLAELGPIGLLLLLVGLAAPLIGLRNLNNSSWGLSVCLLAVVCAMLFEFQFWLDPHWRAILFWLIGLYWVYRLQPEQLKT
ncbi:MAG: O-antigen ligase family protein [Anaerolineae bacterium]|nr:O-antigen ligase family protein [Anaerolineae bacterium]